MQQQQPPQPDVDLPAGPPTNLASSIPFFEPLHQLANKSVEQFEQDMEEVNRYFEGEATIVSKEVQQAIKKTIWAKKDRDDGELFTAVRKIDPPDAKIEACGKRLKCGHSCEEPKAVKHECGMFCSAIKTFTRPCGHPTYIYCARKESITVCQEKCGKLDDQGFPICRKDCHFPSECN